MKTTNPPVGPDQGVSSQPAPGVEELGERGVRLVAITIVDNAGIARAKVVPVAAFERSLRWGVGLSPVFGVSTVTDTFTATASVGGPTGDVRLIPDASALRVPAGDPGWAWAPADQHMQDGAVFGCCQRSFACRMVEEACARGLELRLGSELEWFLARDGEGELTPAHAGPGYGFAAIAELGDHLRELVACFVDSGVNLGQMHAEYEPGQLEISLPPAGPVRAADLNVFSRHVIRTASRRDGFRASFSPVFSADRVGNGGHLHFSVWEGDRNLLAGGEGPYGMSGAGESFLAGVLAQLPPLMAIGAPSVASYLRLRPSHWAGVFACWGRENREAAMRFVTGMSGSESWAANCEVKCFDQSANPYLAIGAVIAAGLDGVESGLTLPPEILEDPGGLSEHELQARGAHRLPTSLDVSLAALERSDLLHAAMGDMLFDAVVAVRRAELEAFAHADTDTVVAAHRWRY